MERLAFAVKVAREAGARALQHYGRTEHVLKEGGSPVTAADLAANEHIVGELRTRFPEDAILSEESAEDGNRMTAERVWVVDPLDGTREFLSQNGEFSVMIGMLEDDEPVLGVVHMPVTGTVYAAERGRGAWAESDGGARRPLRCLPDPPGAIRMVGSRSHRNALLERMVEVLGVTDVVPSGSVGIKCARIAEGERDLYIHPAPHLKEWDTCAPEVVLKEAGGAVRDCRGRPLRYNKPIPGQPDGILACVPGLLGHVLDRIGPLYAAAHAAANGNESD